MSLIQLSDKATIQSVRSGVGYFPLEDFGLLEIRGVDAASFLHAQTTNEVKGLGPGQGNMQAILDRKALVKGYFSLHRVDGEGFWLLAERMQMEGLMTHFELYHFSEEVNFTDYSGRFAVLSLHGPKARLTVETALDCSLVDLKEYGVRPIDNPEGIHLVIRRSFTGDEGFCLVVEKERVDFWQKKLMQDSDGVVAISPSAMEVMRVEAGIPAFGIDMDVGTQLTDTGLERLAVSYTKGCFPGQEIVAKVKTYGSSPRSLVGLIFEEQTELPPTNAVLQLDGRDIGVVKSGVHSVTLNHPIALAYLHRDYRVPGKNLEPLLQGASVRVKVVLLPFYKPMDAHEKASVKYDEALQRYAQDKNTEAIALLREAIELDPHYSVAYEALGVILSKQGELDEAIRLMQKLAELDPDEVMAHTNLSVFYMQKGWKEEAEQEKAIATTLQFKRHMEAQKQKKIEEAEREKQRQALEEKVVMFKEVLELDAEDSLANYGLGNTLVELSRFDEAIPYLEKAIATQPKYTVAYLALGKAYDGAGQRDRAKAIFKQGIEVAAQKGDLMPLKEMEVWLARLG